MNKTKLKQLMQYWRRRPLAPLYVIAAGLVLMSDLHYSRPIGLLTVALLIGGLVCCVLDIRDAVRTVDAEKQ